VAELDPAPPARRRADAERNISTILDTAVACLAERPDVTMAEIARAAGVGRVTLYAHFPSREQLLGAALDRAVAEVEAALGDDDLEDGPADEALSRLIRTSWPVLDRHRTLFEAVSGAFDHRQMRHHHDPALARFDKLIARGQREGRFRTDLPRDWLVAVVFGLFHTAAAEVNTHHIRPGAAADILDATIQTTLTPPPRR
jgi:AcrR family transcriptional regulator